MAERGISLAEVQSVYDGAEITYAGKRGTMCLEREIGGRIIKIVVFVGTDIVKTVIDRTPGAP